jgi:hypothetical protein
MITGLTSHEAVTIDTICSSNSNDTLAGGLYGCHAYAAIGYNASTQLFTLYNPWGFDQPSLLTWTQLEQNCEDFAVSNPSGSTPMSALPAASHAVSSQGVAQDTASAIFATFESSAQSPTQSSAMPSAPPTARAVDDLLAAGDSISNPSQGGRLGYWSILEDAADSRADAQSDSGDKWVDFDGTPIGAQLLQTLDDSPVCGI